MATSKKKANVSGAKRAKKAATATRKAAEADEDCSNIMSILTTGGDERARKAYSDFETERLATELARHVGEILEANRLSKGENLMDVQITWDNICGLRFKVLTEKGKAVAFTGRGEDNMLVLDNFKEWKSYKGSPELTDYFDALTP